MATIAQLRAVVSVEGATVAQTQLSGLGKSVDGAGVSLDRTTPKLMAHDQALKTVSHGSLLMGAGLLAGFGMAAGAAMNFDKAMSGVGAVSDASSRDMGRLREAAIEAGKATVFSASQAAEAEAELAKAGVGTADILGGALTGSLNLASAGQIDLGESATIAAQAMNIFKLQGSDVSHIADVLAAGANKSAADVSQLGQALQQGGLLARQTGLDLEDTVGALALFADNALQGSDAGTSLKTMLQRLTPQSDEAAQLMEQLGISAYDAGGQFVGLDKFAGSLRKSLKSLTPEQRNSALATIFGSDAVRAANILYDAGAKGVDKYRKAVNDQGAAARMAGKQLDNLAGDAEQLRGSLETALIKGGSGATDVLRGMTQGATATVNATAGLPDAVQGGVVGLAGIAGGGLLVAGAVGTMVPKVKEGIEAFKSLKASASELPGAFGKIGSAAGTVALGLGTAFAVFTQWQRSVDNARRHADANAAEVLGGLNLKNLEGVSDGLARARSELSKTLKELKPSAGAGGSTAQIWQNLNPFVDDDIQDLVARKEKYEKIIDDLRAAQGRISESTGRVRGKLSDMFGGDTIPKAQLTDKAILKVADSLGVDLSAKGEAGRQAVREVAAAMEGQTSAAYGSAESLNAVGAAAGDGAAELDAFKQKMDSLLGVHLDAQSADIQFRDDLDALTKSVVDNGLTFDLNTDAGRRNQEQTIATSRAALAHAEAVGKEGGGVQAANLVLQQHVGQLGETLHALGLSDEATLTYIEDLYGIPPEQRTDIRTTADLARLLVQGLHLDINNLPKNTDVNINTYRREHYVYDSTGAVNSGGGSGGHAAGGVIGRGNEWSWVGEQGKELLHLPPGSQIHSNAQSMAMLREPSGTGSATTVVHVAPTFNVPVGADLVEMGRQYVKAVSAFERASGSSWRNN